MHRVEFHRRVLRALKRMPQDRSRQIVSAIEELASIESPATHRNVRTMQGDFASSHRMRVGDYRVIFQLADDPNSKSGTLLISVTHTGPRGDIY